MCGIVGLLVKRPALRERLGELMLPMLIGMTERGPDSSGMAVFTEPVAAEKRKLSLYAGAQAIDWEALRATVAAALNTQAEISVKKNHATLTTGAAPNAVKAWLKAHQPGITVLSAGRAIDLYKDLGLPIEVAQRYDFAHLTGTHLVGHTRMATESAVTVENAHPYTAGEDWCLVHNGSLSNPYQLRRELEPLGIEFDGDCDTEAACRYLEWRMREGDDLETAIEHGFTAFDGFYTFLMGTRDKLALVRDPFACKPAIVAETDDYVAIASEFRSLAHLPDVKHATLFEPKPEHIYSWSI
ncbi:MAG: glutamine amidotransferase class-II family protein [Betaproteobacteria bacterium]|nr:glutamine amidotransferase class-II family protein [Betaproteobacteria bacterium]